MLCMLSVINVRAMDYDKEILEGAVNLFFLNRAVEKHFYESLLNVLKKEQEQLKKLEVNRLLLPARIACAGCGEVVLCDERITHLTFECNLSAILPEKIETSSDSAEEWLENITENKKIDMVQCDVCHMPMPEQTLVAHKANWCPGQRYRIKKRRNKTSYKKTNKKIKIKTEK